MTAKSPERTVYAPHEIDAALTTLAYYGGNSARASEATGISSSTLRDWRTALHRERYLQIAEREAPRLEATAAQQARELILRASEAEHSILDRLNDRLDDSEASSKELSELAGTLQRLTTSKGINGTKLLELTGRPTSIIEHREGNEILRALGARIPGLVIDSTAVEIPPAQPLPSASDAVNARDRVSKPVAD